MKLKYFLFGGIALAMAACADENITGGNETTPDVPDSPLSTASYTIGGGDQSRAMNTGKWSSRGTRSITSFTIVVPSSPDSQNYIVANQNDVWSLPENLNNVNIYITGDVDQFEVRNAGPNIKVYIVDGVNVNWPSQNTGSMDVYNDGNLTFSAWSLQSANNIKNIYNTGYIEINGTNNDWVSFASGHEIYSDGVIEVTCNTLTLESAITATTLIVNGNLKVQTGSTKKDICEVECSDNAEIVTDLTVGKITATELSFDGAKIYLHPEGYVYAKNQIVFPNSICEIKAAEGSTGVVETNTLSIHLVNCPLNVTFQAGVYLEIKELFDRSSWNNVDFSDLETAAGPVNSGHKVNPSCGAEPEIRDNTLDEVATITPPTHDHDADKNDPNRRHLSATSLTFDENGNIYASYHMRGGNWGGDTYDKDDIEGCIERWDFDGNSISIGNWMWTNEFDFNHIILDGDNIITVGHKGGEKTIQGSNGQSYTDFGGIIGRLPVDKFFNTYIDAEEYTEGDFEYKYLTTDEELYGYFENESGNSTYQKIDYKSAGDGNCVVRVGNEYYVATSAGYGKINASDFSRIKDAEGNVQFVSTPGSTKYLVNNNGTVNLLYLNDRPLNASLANTSYSATLSSMATEAFPTQGTTTTTRNNVTPVDGKNVIAVDNGTVYACLSKGGLQIGNSAPIVFSDEENGVRSVNGVAVDSNYIYVANGSFLTVLDKYTQEKIAERKGNSKNVSANFVEVKEYNGTTYIFVAFGQDGIKVYTLNLAK